jgi:hypothetical protein
MLGILVRYIRELQNIFLLCHLSCSVISKCKWLTCWDQYFYTNTVCCDYYSCVWTSTWYVRVENWTWKKPCLPNWYSCTARQRHLSSGHGHVRRVREKKAVHSPWLPSNLALWSQTSCTAYAHITELRQIVIIGCPV